MAATGWETVLYAAQEMNIDPAVIDAAAKRLNELFRTIQMPGETAERFCLCVCGCFVPSWSYSLRAFTSVQWMLY